MQTKSAERIAFDHWLRTGVRLIAGDAAEHKFNPWHDPDDGRFTFAGQGRYFPGSGGRQSSHAGRPAPRSASPKAKQSTIPSVSHHAPAASSTSNMRRNSLGSLSERHEVPGTGPGTISSGGSDPGGVSYGSYQLSTKAGTLTAFLAGPEFKPWAELWLAEAARDPDVFRDAQRAFILRTHYEPAVMKVARSTGFNLDKASNAVREAAFSVSVQHGGAATILGDAVRRTDKRLKRSDPRYERALIINIYDRRIEYVTILRDRAKAQGRSGAARMHSNDIIGRYPEERSEALRLLSAQ